MSNKAMHDSQQERDFKQEVAELLEKFPELVGQRLPQEVVDEAMAGESLVSAYEKYQAKNLRAKAPVTGVSGGGAVNERGVDDFLRGFNS